MFEYEPTTATAAPAAPVASAPKPVFDLGEALAVARRNAGLIAATGLLGALVAYGASHLLTPRYVATAEIYIDPGSAQSANSEPIAPGQDSNGFVNYVETQKLLVTSRSVLERVARAEALDRDPDFGGQTAPSFWGALLRAPSSVPADAIATAARALSAHIVVTRPERTFVLDISVSDRDPERAAAIANATAEAYIAEVTQLRADASKQTGAAIADRLEDLRGSVIKAEDAIAAYKADKGLAGTHDASSIELQLKALQDQIGAQRVKESDARARAEGAEAARKNDSELGAFASQFGLITLSQLRGQQAEARQKLADARATLGPRHPDTLQAEARLKAADSGVDAELTRFARSQRLEYQRARATETDLERQLETVKTLTDSDDVALVGLRDLERKAQAARDIYELFVTRSRDSGAIQEVAPTRNKIVTVASPPKGRTFPPSAATLSGVGFVVGLALGLAAAFARDTQAPRVKVMSESRAPFVARVSQFAGRANFLRKRAQPPAGPEPVRAPVVAPVVEAESLPSAPRLLVVGARGGLVATASPQTLAALDLSGLGFRTLAANDDSGEFLEVLNALPRPPSARRVVAVTGDNERGDRSGLAINLALAAARTGADVALIDAAGRNAKLTRAVRLATRLPLLDARLLHDTVNAVKLALPKAGDASRGRVKPVAVLSAMIEEGRFDWIFCDGPDAGEVGADEVFALADGVVALDDESTALNLDDLDVTPAVRVRFAPPTVAQLRRA